MMWAWGVYDICDADLQLHPPGQAGEHLGTHSGHGGCQQRAVWPAGQAQADAGQRTLGGWDLEDDDQVVVIYFPADYS